MDKQLPLLAQILETQVQQDEQTFMLENATESKVKKDIQKTIDHNIATVETWKTNCKIDPDAKELADDKAQMIQDMLDEATRLRDFYQRRVDSISNLQNGS